MLDDEPVLDCGEVIRILENDCQLNLSENDSPGSSRNCDGALATLMLEEACPGFTGDDVEIKLCGLGFSAHCFHEYVAPAEIVENCSGYILLEEADACEYYLCREDITDPKERCGSEGYYVAYGYEYCTRFQEEASDWLSEEGMAWVDRVMPCLMSAIEEEVDSLESCDGVLEIAYDSHPECYVETGFCDLTLEDMALIFLTIDSSDFDLQQALKTGVSCLAQ